jgi:hypothetical protein
MIFSDLPSPAEASSHTTDRGKGFAQAGNRNPLFGIMLLIPGRTLALDSTSQTWKDSG